LSGLARLEAFVEHATAALQGDERVVAAWLGGSLAAGTADAYSDVDLRVAVADDAFDAFVADWPDVAERLAPTVMRRRIGPPESPIVIAITPEWLRFDVAVARAAAPARVGAEILDAAPRLRVIGELEGDRFAARIDVEAAEARGVRVVDTTNGSSYGVAEWALGMTLNATRNAGELFRAMAAGEWRPPTATPAFERFELSGKRVGLIGLGIIGRRFVQLLQPFGCQISAHDPYVPKEVADVLGVRLTDLDHVMADSDVIVCLAPLTPKTRRMVGARELDLIRPGSALVNVSRGPIFDPDATIARLRRGDVAAAFDVWDPEPIPADSLIRQLPNVVLTPHVSSQTRDGRGRFFKLMVDELDRYFHGHETLYDLTSRTLANRFGREPL
jgi:D-3-phosphoglycerate dehydrogenase